MRRRAFVLRRDRSLLRRCRRVAWLGLMVAGCAVKPTDPGPSLTAEQAGGTTVVARPEPPGDDAAVLTGRAQTELAPTPESSEHKLAVTAPEVDVYAAPSLQASKLGTIRAGSVVRTQQGVLAPGSSPECGQGWYALQSRGFVCKSPGVTTDASDATARLFGEFALAARAALPATYGVAEITPIYLRIPTSAEQARAEPGFDKALRRGASEVRAVKIEVPEQMRTAIVAPARPLPVAADVPVAGALDKGARVAWIAEFDTAERSWLLTPELLFVPSDRVKRSAVSAFHGIEVPNNQGVVFVGNQAVTRYANREDGRRFVPQRQTWPPLTPVLLTEPALSWSDDKYLETVDDGAFIRANEVIVAHPTPPSRWGLEPSASFVEIIARTNLLLLHQGERVTFATLVSVGKGTPRGKFRLFSKHLTTASLLDAPHALLRGAEYPEVLRMSDTPDRPVEAKAIAMYAAWWANAWGSPTGGIGIALAPLDARRIFDATEPALPEGWHSVRGDGTWVVIRD